MFKRVLTGTGTILISAVPVASAKDEKKKGNAQKDEGLTYKPQDLPIYSTVYDSQKKEEPTVSEPSVIYSTLESGVKVVRENACDLASAVKTQKKPVDDFISTGIEHSQFIFDYLNEPANGIHRVGAIAVGALSGYIIASRRGLIRRFIYSSIGGLAVASICYPKEAEQYGHQAVSEAKTYATILYNFAYGVKPGDEPKPLPIPNSFSDAYQSVKNFILPEVKPNLKPNEKK